MNSELLTYLSDEEKKKIAERVYEEELRRLFQEDVAKRIPDIFHDLPTVYHRVLNQYIQEMQLSHEEFIPAMNKLIEKELNAFISEDDDMNTIAHHIRWRLQILSEEVIQENKDELKPIIRDKVFRCCNETLLIAFLSDIVRKMNLDKAVKQIIQESEGDKT